MMKNILKSNLGRQFLANNKNCLFIIALSAVAFNCDAAKEKVKLDPYNIFPVIEQFKDIKDLKTLQMVCKRLSINMEKFRYNPIPLTDENRKYFPNIETQHLYTQNDIKFSGKFEGIKSKDGNVLFPATQEENNGIVKYEVWYPVSYEEYLNATDKGNTTYHYIDCSYQQYLESKNNNTEALKYLVVKFPSYASWMELSEEERKEVKGHTKKVEVIYTREDRRQNYDGVQTSFTIPSSVTSMGDGCFYSCENLEEIIIPSSVTSIGKNCFMYCKNLKGIIIPSGVTSIEDNCFTYCENLEEIIIPLSVTSIGEDCFWGCENLKRIIIPSNVTWIGNGCFVYCKHLKRIIISSNVTWIGNRCFFGCDKLTEIKVVIGENGETEVYDKLKGEWFDKVRLVDKDEYVI